MSEPDDESMDDAPLPQELDNPDDADYQSDASQLSHPDEESDREEEDDADTPFISLHAFPDVRQEFAIQVPTFEDLGTSPEDYEELPLTTTVDRVLAQGTKLNGQLWYEVEFDSGIVRSIPFDELTTLENGPRALNYFYTDAGRPRSAQNGRKSRNQSDFIDLSSEDGSDREDEDGGPSRRTRASSSMSTQRELRKRKFTLLSEKRRTEQQAPESDEGEVDSPPRRTHVSTRSAGKQTFRMLQYGGSGRLLGVAESEDDGRVYSDLYEGEERKTRRSTRARTVKNKKRSRQESSEESEDYSARRSGRDKKQKQSYREIGMEEDLVGSDLAVQKPSKPKVVHSKEIFPLIDESEKFDDFVQAHCPTCDTCGGTGTSYTRGKLIYCQGCSTTYHKECLGNRATREHLVTKISSDNFVLQCRRCINRPRMKDRTAPAYDRCVDCYSQGQSCAPFRPLRPKKNKDVDTPTDISRPVTPDADVDHNRLYNAQNVLFRCSTCHRAWHYDHLPPRGNTSGRSLSDWEKRVKEYTEDYRCLDCVNFTVKLQVIVAWRPADPASRKQEDGIPLELPDFTEDEREYLIKGQNQSYFQVKWVPGSWVAGAFPEIRRGFVTKKAQKPLPEPIMTTEEAVKEEWLRIDICLDVQYTSLVSNSDDVEVDLARVNEVSKALVKFSGLGYEDVVWEEPPKPEDKERWEAWWKAYQNYIYGKYVRIPKNMNKKCEKVRSTKFEQLELKTQPEYISGGTLMGYQKEGMNWLYYKWWKGQNTILADEMGLGKTIQIISFLSILYEQHRLFPFLIVVPHPTVPNWKREIQTWAPNLRVVAYYGSDAGRKLQRKYEMFHAGTFDLKCHVVVTSYTVPRTPSDAAILRKIPWEGLIVDEGQALKNESSLLYTELNKFKFRHKILLTGTPLQNNPRELFNLLQFLDPKDMKAADLEEKYGELTNETVPELHKLIRPFFLRRTKAQVLTHLPPMAEVIVPVSMSTLQKELYKSILSKDPALIKSILYRSKVKQNERAKLNNLLMQLRKCVCHPYLYNEDLEEELDDPAMLHKNLVEAGPKLGLLSIMLPKLRERGHRVLIFSQFRFMLDLMEDFLNWLGMQFQRLDGSVSGMDKQKRIDAFNAPDSEDFVFLLSTRAGGVGINLATADTVIIMDPDFNPHQDLQALSRAHRIGQKKKVLVFHLMTRDTVEERMIQIGKKKLSLDHLIIEKMGNEEEEKETKEDIDVESILKFGAARLFDDEGEDRTIRYDDESVDKLLDRSTIEQTRTSGEDGNEGAENAFSFARVWANDKGALEDKAFGDTPEVEEEAPPGFWERVLRERQEQARLEATAQEQQLGRGRRRRTVNYTMEVDKDGGDQASDDTDFQAESNDESSSDEENVGPEFAGDDFLMKTSDVPLPHPVPLQVPNGPLNTAVNTPAYYPPKHGTKTPALPPQQYQKHDLDNRVEIIPLDREDEPKYDKCKACKYRHAPGRCAMKEMGTERCPFCGLAHFGRAPSCPHFTSETQMNAMLDALRDSTEDRKLVEEAKSYVRGRKGHVQREKRKMAAKMSVSKASSVSADGGAKAQ